MTMRQWSNLTKCGYLSTQSPLRSTHFFHRLLQHLDSHGTEDLILILEKVLNCRYDLIGPIILLLSQFIVFLHVGEQKIATRSQIRFWRVININQFKATVTHSSHCNHRLVCRSIILVKQDSLRQFFRPSPKCTIFQSPE